VAKKKAKKATKSSKKSAASKKKSVKKSKAGSAKKAKSKKVAKKAAKKVEKKVEKKALPPVPPKKAVTLTPKNKQQYTQSELYDCIVACCGFRNRREAKEFYSGFAGMIQGALKGGFRIPLPGLGKIQVRKTKARMGRNPFTQETIKIPARRKVRFTPNKALKEAVL